MNKRTDEEVRAIALAELRKEALGRKKYLHKYWLKNKKQLHAYRVAWQNNARRKKSVAFTSHGFVHTTGRVEVVDLRFYSPKKKGSLTR